MNIRKPVDYSEMFSSLDTIMAAQLPQMELYYEIGRLVSARVEKGAAVAAAEYLQKTYPENSGFSPRNLRRMREFCRTYKETPDLMAEAMKLGWTQNVVIMEADLTEIERAWYIQTAQRFSWPKLELADKIRERVHKHLNLDTVDGSCYTGAELSISEDASGQEPIYLSWQYLQESDRRICNERPREESWIEGIIHKCICGYQYGGNRQSRLSTGPPQDGRVRALSRWLRYTLADGSQLRRIHSPDRHRQRQPPQYALHLR